MLIANGHSFDKIPDYTIRQFQSFVTAIDDIRKNELLVQLAVNATAAQGDEAGIKKLQSTLGGKTQSIPDQWITK